MLSIEFDAFFIDSIIVFIPTFLVLLFKRKYTIWGYIIFALTYFCAVQLINVTMLPLYFGEFEPNDYTLTFIPFYTTIKYFHAIRTLRPDNNVVLYFLGFIMYGIPIGLGHALLNVKKKNVYVVPILVNGIFMFVALVLAMFNRNYVFDFGVFICSGIGSCGGVLLGKALIKNNIFKIKTRKETEVE